jgi:transaldolase
VKFFLDTANLDEIREAIEMGLIDGVTTNPTLVAKEGREFRPLVEEICSIVPGPVSLETVSPDARGMVKEAKDLVTIGENVVVKVPMTTEGLKAVRAFFYQSVCGAYRRYRGCGNGRHSRYHADQGQLWF